MSADELLLLNSPIHGIAWAIGMVLIALWIATAFWFIFVAVVHQIQRGIRLLIHERLEDEPRHSYPLRGL